MENITWLALVAGALTGVVTGLVPGLHVNTVCAVFLALMPAAGPTGAVALAAAGASHAFASNLPATYLGSPGEETLASALPAHRMLLEGRGPEAIHVSLVAGLAALAAAVVLVLPYKWLLLEPVGALDWIERHMTLVLASLLLFLLAREALGGLQRAAICAGLLALSGLLGWIALGWNVKALVPVAATSLLPLLSGLFGAPALLEGLAKPAPIPLQTPAPAHQRYLGPSIASGIAASAATAILPGLSSSVAVALARAGRRTDDPRPVLATQAAIASAHLVLSFTVLWLSLRARTGLAVAVQQLQPSIAWTSGAAPASVLPILQACLAGGAVGAVASLVIDRWASRHVHHIPGRALAAGALATTLVLVVVLSGWAGLVLFGVATAIGCLPAASGLGRLHLTGALLVPVLAMRLGFNP